jgi:hypothetical protein
MGGFVEWRIATRTCVNTGFGQVLVIFAGKRCFSAFFSENSELFYEDVRIER